ncbi:hypothetical protein ACOMHN_056567 [Nucella lapillus]
MGVQRMVTKTTHSPSQLGGVFSLTAHVHEDCESVIVILFVLLGMAGLIYLCSDVLPGPYAGALRRWLSSRRQGPGEEAGLTAAQSQHRADYGSDDKPPHANPPPPSANPPPPPANSPPASLTARAHPEAPVNPGPVIPGPVRRTVPIAIPATFHASPSGSPSSPANHEGARRSGSADQVRFEPPAEEAQRGTCGTGPYSKSSPGMLEAWLRLSGTMDMDSPRGPALLGRSGAAATAPRVVSGGAVTRGGDTARVSRAQRGNSALSGAQSTEAGQVQDLLADRTAQGVTGHPLLGSNRTLQGSDRTLQGSADSVVHVSGKTTIQRSGDNTVQGSGDNAVQGSGDNAVQGSGDNAVQGSGDNAVQGSGDNTVQGSGDNAVQGSGDNAVQGSGDNAVQGSGPVPWPDSDGQLPEGREVLASPGEDSGQQGLSTSQPAVSVGSDWTIGESTSSLSSASSYQTAREGSSPDITVTEASPDKTVIEASPDKNFSQGTSPDKTFSQGTSPDKTFSQGTSPDKNFSQGTSPDKTFSQGTSPDKTFSQGTSPDKTFSQGTSPDKNFSQGTSPDKTFSQGTSPDSTQ